MFVGVENFWVYVLQATVNVSIYIFFALKTFENNFKLSKPVTYVISVVYIEISVVFIELFIEKIAPFPQYLPIASIAWGLISVGFCFITIRATISQILFFVLTIFNVAYNVITISLVLFELGVYPHIFSSSDTNGILLTVIVLLAVTPMMWYLFVNLFKKAINLNLSSKYGQTLFVLPLSFYLFGLLNQPGSLFEQATVQNLIASLLLYFCTFLAYVSVLQLLIKTYESLTANKRVSLNEQMLLMQQEQYNNLARNIEKTAGIRRDIRHHTIVIQDLANRGDVGGLREYMQKFSTDNPMENEIPICDNLFVDLIVGHYMSEAKRDGIKVYVSLDIPSEFKFSAPKLYVVFGNLMENALESCRCMKNGEKFLELKAKKVSENSVAIMMNNSCDRKIIFNGDNIMSTKYDGIGMGTTSIRVIAEANGGNCKFSLNGKIFKTHILLVED